jgi:hypothetical protein
MDNHETGEFGVSDVEAECPVEMDFIGHWHYTQHVPRLNKECNISTYTFLLLISQVYA